jgi:hypothetical protein
MFDGNLWDTESNSSRDAIGSQGRSVRVRILQSTLNMWCPTAVAGSTEHVWPVPPPKQKFGPMQKLICSQPGCDSFLNEVVCNVKPRLLFVRANHNPHLVMRQVHDISAENESLIRHRVDMPGCKVRNHQGQRTP